MASGSPPCILECPICQQSLARSIPPVVENDDGVERVPGEQTIHLESSSRWSTVCTPCGHLFHKACILEWFRVRRHYDGGSLVRGTCPTCRKSVAYHKLTKVYLPTRNSSNSNLDSPPLSSTSTSSQSSHPSSSSQSQSSRISVSNAVRRYTQQHLEDPLRRERNENEIPAQGNVQSLSIGRVYNEFLNLLCQENIGDRGDILDNPRSRRRTNSSRDETFSPSCGNEDCVALRNVYFILSKEYKSLQRKYELEVDVSKMKSILVTNLQRDLDLLKLERYADTNTVPYFWYMSVSGIALVLIWIFARFCIFLMN